MRNYEAKEYRRGYKAGIEAAIVHAFWSFDGELKFISTSIPANVRMKEDLGTATHTISRLRCSRCNMITLVDETIWYAYCPHCGATMHYFKERREIMNGNCYDFYPKEERKFIQDFIDDADFMAAELRNLYKLKAYKLRERHPDDIADGELYHLEHLETIIDTAEDIAHELRRYKEDIC